MQKRTFLKSALALGVALSAAPILTACSKAEPEKQAAAQAPAAAPAAAEARKLKPIKVAVTAGPHADIVTKAAEVAKKQGFDVKVVEFTDYITPDTALAEKQLDVAVYQHEPFLLNFNKQKGTDLVVAANAVVQPMGLYSNKIHSLDDIKADTKIAIPNDPSNGGRALVLLEKAGIIKLTPENPSSTKKRVLKKWCSSAYFCKISFWFCMLSLSPACISSWLNLQYKAVILSVCNILSSFPTTDKHGICTVYIIPHTAACVMYKM